MGRLMSQFAREAEFLNAAAKGTLEDVQHWVAAGVDVHVLDKKGRNALYMAALKNGDQPEVFRYLAQLGLRRDIQASDGESLIDLVVVRGLTDHLDALIEQGDSINRECPTTQRTLLMRAAMSDTGLAMVAHLLAQGARVDAADVCGNTALHVAASPEIANVLLDAGAVIDAVNVSDQKTPLMALIQVSPDEMFYNGEREVARTLISRGADVEVASDGVPILHQMASRGDVEAVLMLLDAGASPDSLDYLGRTALLATLGRPLSGQPEGDRPAVVRLLAGRGASIDVQYEGSGCLHIAASCGDVDVFAALLESGADPAVVDADGNTLSNIIAHVDLQKAQQLKLIHSTHMARHSLKSAAGRAQVRSQA